MKSYLGLGLMSGTSLDGLDIAFVKFTKDKHWSFEILKAETIAYDSDLKDALHGCFHYSALDFQKFHHSYGRWLGKTVSGFISKHHITPQFIASHGHTIFHDPAQGFTTQIGSGAEIYAQTGVATVCDFRTVDVALGGQGAPLVPQGDRDLFGKYEYLLNLGGIANITHNSIAKAYDITVANMALNHYAQQLGKDYDDDGQWARVGMLHKPLLERLNDLPFFKQQAPKSLGREFFEREFLAILNDCKLSPQDFLHTLCHHIAFQIGLVIQESKSREKMIITGGGALNGFLVDCIRQACPSVEVVLPDRKTIEFKEALIFGYLGLLRILGQNNCLSSVTGAQYDAMGGAVYGNYAG